MINNNTIQSKTNERLNPVALGRLISRLNNLATHVEIETGKALPKSKFDSINATGKKILESFNKDLTL